MSALATIFGSIGELSESELRQLYLAIGVRLNISDVPTGAKPQPGKAGFAGSAKSSTAKGGKKTTTSKGNPSRKSQWANHPLYQEYSRLKKVVEHQSKEQKCSFNSVDTAESRAYKQAFTDWVEAKHSFRGHSESDQTGGKPASETKIEEEESSEEEEAGKPSSSVVRAKPGPPQAAPAASGKPTPSPPRKGKAVAK